MFCSKCGSEIKQGEKFCGVCGNQISFDETTQPIKVTPVSPDKDNSVNKKVIVIAAAAAAVIIVGIICIAGLFSGSNKPDISDNDDIYYYDDDSSNDEYNENNNYYDVEEGEPVGGGDFITQTDEDVDNKKETTTKKVTTTKKETTTEADSADEEGEPIGGGDYVTETETTTETTTEDENRELALYDRENWLSRSNNQVFRESAVQAVNNDYFYNCIVYRYFKSSCVPSTIKYLLEGEYNTVSGVYFSPKTNATSNYTGQAFFEVYGDGELLYTSPVITAESLPIDFEFSVSGVQKLEIVFNGTDSTAFNGYGDKAAISELTAYK